MYRYTKCATEYQGPTTIYQCTTVYQGVTTMYKCNNATDDIKPLQILSSSLPLSSPSSSWWSASTGGTKNILLLGKLKKLDIVRTRGEQNHNIKPSS